MLKDEDCAISEVSEEQRGLLTSHTEAQKCVRCAVAAVVQTTERERAMQCLGGGGNTTTSNVKLNIWPVTFSFELNLPFPIDADTEQRNVEFFQVSFVSLNNRVLGSICHVFGCWLAWANFVKLLLFSCLDSLEIFCIVEFENVFFLKSKLVD